MVSIFMSDATTTNTDSHDKLSMLMAIALGLTAAFIWGAWPVISKLSIDHTLSAYDLTAFRVGIAGIILLPLIFKNGTGGLGLLRAFILSFGAGAPYMLLAAGGLNYSTAGHFGVIAPSCMLLTSTIGSWFLFGDRPSAFRLIGLAAILAGVSLIGWKAFSVLEERQWIGDLMFAGAGVLWAGYTLGTRAWSVTPLQATALVPTVSAVFYLPYYFLFVDTKVLATPPLELALHAGFQGILNAILALLIYTKVVSILGAARGAVFATTVPGIAVILAFPVLGEVPTSMEITGVVAVSAGMVLAIGLIKRK
jgi:drug/metabolite transporter (DMT)-like permease